MQPDSADTAYLLDMLHHAQGAITSLENVTFEQYLADENLRLAVERRLEIIGEAARGVSRSFQQAHVEIPWQKIVAQRHILAHEYGEIDSELIWRVVKVYLPELIEALRDLAKHP